MVEWGCTPPFIIASRPAIPVRHRRGRAIALLGSAETERRLGARINLDPLVGDLVETRAQELTATPVFLHFDLAHGLEADPERLQRDEAVHHRSLRVAFGIRPVAARQQQRGAPTSSSSTWSSWMKTLRSMDDSASAPAVTRPSTTSR